MSAAAHAVLVGQAIAYCEAIHFGIRVAGQLTVAADGADALCELISAEGCKVKREPIGDDRLALWIYREDAVASLVDELISCPNPTSATAIWAMGKLFGYCDAAVIGYVARSASAEESSPRPCSDTMNWRTAPARSSC